MCRSVDGDGKAQSPTTRFGVRDSFYCSVRALGVKPGSELVGFWQSPSGLTNKRVIVSDKTGDYYVYFGLTPRRRTPWEPGQYTLSLIADGVLQQTVTFEVQSDDVQSEASPKATDAASHVSEVVPCEAVTDRHRPVAPMTRFSSSIPAIYVAAHVVDVTQGKVALTKWYYDGRLVKDIEMKVPTDGSGWLSFKLSAPNWPSGHYKVEVYYDGDLARTTEFSVP